MKCPHSVPLDGKFDLIGRQLMRPCGSCAICRRNKVMSVTSRANYEWVNHKYNAFTCVTYDDNHLYFPQSKKLGIDKPIGMPSVCKKDVQKLIDNIRHHLKRVDSPFKDFSYIYCTEYGGITSRPHAHILFFGIDFPYAKKLLQKFWDYGFVDSKPLKNGGIRYVIKYLSKQSNGDSRDLQFHDRGIEPPCVKWSSSFGSGLFFEHSDEIKQKGFIRFGSKIISVPPYYLNKIRNFDSSIMNKQFYDNEKKRHFKKGEASFFGFDTIREYEKKRALYTELSDLHRAINHKEQVNLEELYI